MMWEISCAARILSLGGILRYTRQQHNQLFDTAYVPIPEGWWPWYSGFKKAEHWNIGVVHGVGRAEVNAMTGGS